MRIYLIGYSFSGKTTMGRQLANLLHYDFFDTDKAIELKLHTTIPLLFERYGEEAFRIIESNILRTTAERDNIVVSTGGGTACSDDNLRFILDNGISVYLHMDLEGTLRRVAASRKKRPLLEGMTPDQRRLYINQTLNQRHPYYSQAHITVDGATVTPQQILEKIENLKVDNGNLALKNKKHNEKE